MKKEGGSQKEISNLNSDDSLYILKGDDTFNKNVIHSKEGRQFTLHISWRNSEGEQKLLQIPGEKFPMTPRMLL